MTGRDYGSVEDTASKEVGGVGRAGDNNTTEGRENTRET